MPFPLWQLTCPFLPRGTGHAACDKGPMCFTWFAHNCPLHHLSVLVWDWLQHSEEIVKSLQLCLSMSVILKRTEMLQAGMSLLSVTGVYNTVQGCEDTPACCLWQVCTTQFRAVEIHLPAVCDRCVQHSSGLWRYTCLMSVTGVYNTVQGCGDTPACCLWQVCPTQFRGVEIHLPDVCDRCVQHSSGLWK